jgi:hypothetical protein
MAGSGESLAQIDAALADARAAVAKLGTALFELDAERERRAAHLPPLTGSSEAAWVRTGSQLSVLWAWYQALAREVEAIGDRRKASGLRPDDIAEIWRLLSTASVEVPPDSRELASTCLPQAGDVPEKTPIASLVRVISAGYEQVAETITSLFAVMDMALPRLEELDRIVSTAQDQATTVGLRVPNEVLDLRRQLGALRDRACRDPLSLDLEQIPTLAAVIERVRADLAEAAASLGHVEELFAGLEGDLEAAQATIQTAKTAVQTTKEKIEGATIGPEEVDALERTAGELRAQVEGARLAMATDRPTALRAGRALQPKIAALGSDATRLSSVAAEPMALRQELRGRLDAYQAKAYSLGKGEDALLDRLFRAAQDMLYTAPCDLDAAQRRLAAYQAAILAAAEEDRPS